MTVQFVNKWSPWPLGIFPLVQFLNVLSWHRSKSATFGVGRVFPMVRKTNSSANGVGKVIPMIRTKCVKHPAGSKRDYVLLVNFHGPLGRRGSNRPLRGWCRVHSDEEVKVFAKYVFSLKWCSQSDLEAKFPKILCKCLHGATRIEF